MINLSCLSGLRKSLPLAACLLTAGCAGNKAYLVNPPSEENVVKVAMSVTVKNKVSKPTKSFYFYRKMLEPAPSGGYTSGQQFGNLFLILGLPLDFVLLPYTAVYDLSPHYAVAKRINLDLEAKLVNGSGGPLGDWPVTIKANELQDRSAMWSGEQIIKTRTDSEGIFKADFQDLTGAAGDKIRIAAVLTDADPGVFAKGRTVSATSPVEVEYLITIGDGSLSVGRTDKYVRAKIGPAEGRDTLAEEFQPVTSQLPVITASKIELSSKKNEMLLKQEADAAALQRKTEEEARQAFEVAVKREKDLATQREEAAKIKEEAEQKKYALKMKRACPNGINPIYALIQANPFDVEGKCYEFVAETMQILTRTTALFNLSGQIFYIDFGSDAAPNIYFKGIVKGAGIFRYTTPIGAIKQVPHLSVVSKTE